MWSIHKLPKRRYEGTMFDIKPVSHDKSCRRRLLYSNAAQTGTYICQAQFLGIRGLKTGQAG